MFQNAENVIKPKIAGSRFWSITCGLTMCAWTGVDSAFPYTSGSEALYVMDDLGPRAILTAAGVVQCAPVTFRRMKNLTEEACHFIRLEMLRRRRDPISWKPGPSGVTAVMTQQMLLRTRPCTQRQGSSGASF